MTQSDACETMQKLMLIEWAAALLTINTYLLKLTCQTKSSSNYMNWFRIIVFMPSIRKEIWIP
jgi:hypothetical protein